MISGLKQITKENTGNKFNNLRILSENNIRTVRGFYLTKDVFDAELRSVFFKIVEFAKSKEMDSIETINDISKYARNEIESLELNEKIRQEIESEMNRMSDVIFFAVRSSMVSLHTLNSEDSVSHAFAGMSDTYLYVHPSAVLEHIKKCWASGFNPEALLYRIKNNIAPFDFSVSVGIQEMIDAQKSFVIFNIDPVTYKDNTLISCCYGVGEGVVQDKAESDLFVVKNQRGDIKYESNISEKRHFVERNPMNKNGTIISEIKDVKRIKEPVLNSSEIEALYKVAKKIESIFKKPQDIEGCIDKNNVIYIVQSRPINTENPVYFFSNYNLTENYPGHSKFLTYSFSRIFYSALLTDAYKKIGIPYTSINKLRYEIDNVLSYHDNGVYYNINNFSLAHRHIFNTIPFMKIEWEKRIALPVSIRDVRDIKTPSFTKMKIIFNLVLNVFLIDYRSKKFQKWWDSTIQKHEAKPVEEELTSLNRFMSELFNNWGWTITSGLTLICLNYFSRKLSNHLGIKGDDFNRFISSTPELKSVEVLNSFILIAKKIKSNQESLDIFNKFQDDEVLSQLAKNENTIEIQRMIDEHLSKYGARGFQELKLETKSYRIYPEELIKRLKVSVGSEITHDAEDLLLSHNKSAFNEKILLEKPLIYRMLFKFLIHKMLAFVKLREDTRYLRSEIFDYAKHVFAKVSEKLVYRGLINKADDIHFLSYDEINSAVLGQVSPSFLKSIVALRESEFLKNLEKECPSSFFSKDGVLIDNETKNSVLSGIGSSYGIATGYIKIVNNPNEVKNLSKETILVTRETDPAWLFLMISAGGIIVEKGSILSHTAITGRKLGIPTIVGVENCTKILKDGQYVEINGGTGNINLISE